MKKRGLHDEFFKTVLSRKDEIAAFIEFFFPHKLVENLEWTTLLKEDTSFVTKKLKKYFSDLLYSCEVKGKIRLKIAFLFEHKSFPVDFPEFQISAYYQRV